MYSIHQLRLFDVVSDPAMNKSTMTPYKASPTRDKHQSIYEMVNVT